MIQLTYEHAKYQARVHFRCAVHQLLDYECSAGTTGDGGTVIAAWAKMYSS